MDMTIERSERFSTLDVFRGMTVFLMIIVNTQGSGAIPYSALLHADWNGCTLTDLVFPSFLFAVGNAMAFTLYSNPLDKETSGIKILKRTLLLFLIGYLLTWYPFTTPFKDTRILAVLQRIALDYYLAAIIVKRLSFFQVGLAAILLLLCYWLLLYILGDPGGQFTMEGNAVRKLDLWILGERHMYREKGIAFDPEGLLSTMPAMVNVLAGWMAGRWIILKGKTMETFWGLLLAGIGLTGIALFWNQAFPFNKKLWTSSYVFFSVGIDMIVLGILFYIIERRACRAWVSFFTVFGKNPLFIYIFSTVIGIFLIIPVKENIIFIDWINTVFFQRIAPGPLGALLFSLGYTLVCWVTGWILDKKKIYIRL
ncbi:acyltransferase family protein [Flavitalea flava]